MTYNKTTWENRVPPRINATKLNKIETGIDEAHDDIVTLNAALVNDLISGVTPTFTDWTSDPTDASYITDGDITTFCTTGSKTTGAGWQYAYLDWDLGSMHNVLCTGALCPAVTAGSGYSYCWFWDGASWVMANDVFVSASSIRHGSAVGGVCSKVRLGITSDAAADVTPNIREFHAWRL